MTATLLELVNDGPAEDLEHERVLDAALQAFLDFGIRRTSMGEIAKRSGLSPATLYRRFSGKDEIVWAVGRREARRLIAEVDAGVDAHAKPEDQVVAMFVAFVGGLRQNRLLHRLLATEPEVILPLLTVNAGPVLVLGRAYLADFIRRVRRQLGLRPIDADPAAEAVARIALSLALTPQTCIPVDDGNAARLFARQFLAGILDAPSG
ncbi:MAG TPA: TetR/AcrR family transcriptional regulator [Acidimicrobiales bacterium]|nr:TetR/AcrR family transcriptional regulator [Acidimicrobiales bacterium]